MAEERVTLPCHHQLGLPEKDTLDIEWLLTDNEGNQKVVGVHPYLGVPLLCFCLPPSVLQPFLLGWKGLELFSHLAYS